MTLPIYKCKAYAKGSKEKRLNLFQDASERIINACYNGKYDAIIEMEKDSESLLYIATAQFRLSQHFATMNKQKLNESAFFANDYQALANQKNLIH